MNGDLALSFNNEIINIETTYQGGLSNTSTKKFDRLISYVSALSGLEKEKIYITAAASRASNLWNRLAQGKPLNTHYTLALGLIGENSLEAGLAPAKTFIGTGKGRYDAICLASKNAGTWKIQAMLEKAGLGVSDKIKESFPELKVETIVDSGALLDGTPYSDEDFLRDVYMDKDRLALLKKLLLRKKNVIIQGAPGVGKSYAAKRLAYAMMEVKDDSRILNVQFHQSYSYEDFIMGYRPSSDGFILEPGPFFEFCNKAKDKEEAYFIIIDEINRGNMSRIFGELLMLIENDKRGDKVKLLYQQNGETFCVPDNVFIIGMMNTADRSLAVIDYALRRRFAFFTFPPAYDDAGFKAYINSLNSDALLRVIDVIKQLNDEIEKDEALGEGFKIGHSYFCNIDVADTETLNGIIEFEIKPLLQEYWFENKPLADKWYTKLIGALNG